MANPSAKSNARKRASNPEPKASNQSKKTKQQSLDSFFAVSKKKKVTPIPSYVAVGSPSGKRNSSSIAETKVKSSSFASNYSHIKKPYTDGDSFPVITKPQEMFDDMIGGRLKQKDQRFLELVKQTQHRPLRVATMCSGTESPLLALDMLQKAIQDACQEHPQLFDNAEPSSLFQLEHVFSCEIEPFKQAYIERNFQPKLLFRDIRELGQDKAHTAYGSEQTVPNSPGDVDVLIAGTSCVDYSNLNNAKKKMEEQGESGSTFWGMMKFIKKAQPPIVIIENVSGAPWEQKVQSFSDLEYAADYMRLDTKQFYIPHTRKRGYLFAVKKQASKGMIRGDSRPNSWKALVEQMKRPASADLDAFILPDDDPRVLRGRARLTAESSADGTRAGRTDWTKCETRHLAARSMEELGDQRPFTGWSDSGTTVLPGHCWNEWANAQVNRIHDLMDINTLRLAADGVDACHKPMVWDLSQNVDRDTIGRLGLCQCLTPSGVHYLTTRGGPLCGEELLMMQGIPAEDLLFTKETEANLKDLAGNAMSTTVVGTCTIAALIVGRAALSNQRDETNNTDLAASDETRVHNLVPRAMIPVSDEIAVRPCFGEYEQRVVDLSPDRSLIDAAAWKAFLRDGASSARKCVSEGTEECFPVDQLVVCRECGHSSSKSNAFPSRKYCEHDFVSLADSSGPRVGPSVFRNKLLGLVPMRIVLHGFDADRLMPPSNHDPDLWKKWVKAFRRAVSDKESGDAPEFMFEKLLRTQIWTAFYRNSNGSRLEARVSKNGVTWFLFARLPSKDSALKTCLESPIARMAVVPSPSGAVSLLHGVWRYCLPTTLKVALTVEGIGDLVPSWRSRLGLKSSFESERQYETLRMTLKDDASLIDNQNGLDRINGEWKLLPKCGGACGSLMKKICASADSAAEDMFFFLDSGKKTLPNADAFVFADSCHRAGLGEFRDIGLQIDPKVGFRPLITDSSHDLCDTGSNKVELSAFVQSIWMIAENASLKPSRANQYSDMHVRLPVTPLSISMHPGAWKICPELLSCTFKVAPTEDILVRCQKNGGSAEVNLHKSHKVLRDLSFATSRLAIPGLFDGGCWLSLQFAESTMNSQDVCPKCSPRLPQIQWIEVSKAGKAKLVPIEDGQEAAVFERAMKERPEPWIIRLVANTNDVPSLSLSIGCNAVSLVQRSLGLFPADSFVRQCLVDMTKSGDIPRDQSMCEFKWRILPHEDIVAADFPRLTFSSNRLDQEAEQPPNFSRYKLRKEQLRSLRWMLDQEATVVPFFEEEVTEAVLPSLNWRAEGRVRRPVLVRGGIVADEVGYGKTAITLGLIDASGADGKLTVQERNPNSLIPTKATLVVVPKHLVGQWPDEITKFLGTSKTVIVIKDMGSLNKLSIRDVQGADIILVCFSVLTDQEYFSRLARFSHVNPSSLHLAGKLTDGSRHFTAVYRECTSSLPARVSEIVDDCQLAYKFIEDAAKSHAQRPAATSSIRLDRKKAVYKMGQRASHASMAKTETKVKPDPWRLNDPKTNSHKDMRSPPLEIFLWKRVVVDEFTYLAKKDRERCLTVIKHLKTSFRWLLSGTPKHSNFNDISALAGLLGVHLGVKEDLPGTRVSNKEYSGLESLQNFLESRSMQWHMRRHALAQAFLDRMVRQNIAEIDEIPFEDRACLIELSSGERAIYLELECHLNSLDMNSKSAQKSKRKSTGDREQRMQKVLLESESAEEALMKCCSHFNMASDSSTASETVEQIISLRNAEQQKLVDEMVRWLTAALRQRQRILDQQPNWLSVTTTEKGEMRDALGVYIGQVEANASVPHGADEEVNKQVKEIVVKAKTCFEADPLPAGSDPFFPGIDLGDESDSNVEPPSKKPKSDRSEEKFLSLFAMKQALRDHMHGIRSLSKELCGRVRSLRYIQHIHRFQTAKDGSDCIACDTSELPVSEAGVLSCCGHAGRFTDLCKAAEEGHCLVPLCTARVSSSHVLSAANFGRSDNQTNETGKFGTKLTALSKKVKEIVEKQGDRVIVFCQFDDLTEKVKDALTSVGIDSKQVKGSVTQQIKTIAVFQKEKPTKGDPRVLLLKMDDEQSAGLNLTNLNHAVFVHPLLADSQEEYDAYETQAIGRLRRFGQTKTVNVWRFLAKDTIDTTIFSRRSGRALPSTVISD